MPLPLPIQKSPEEKSYIHGKVFRKKWPIAPFTTVSSKPLSLQALIYAYFAEKVIEATENLKTEPYKSILEQAKCQYDEWIYFDSGVITSDYRKFEVSILTGESYLVRRSLELGHAFHTHSGRCLLSTAIGQPIKGNQLQLFITETFYSHNRNCVQQLFDASLKYFNSITRYLDLSEYGFMAHKKYFELITAFFILKGYTLIPFGKCFQNPELTRIIRDVITL